MWVVVFKRTPKAPNFEPPCDNAVLQKPTSFTMSKKTSTLAHTNTTGPHYFIISILAFPFLSWDFGAPKALYSSLNSIRSETVCQFLSFCRFLCSPGRLGVLNLRGSTLTFHTSGQLVAKWQQLEILAGLYLFICIIWIICSSHQFGSNHPRQRQSLTLSSQWWNTVSLHFSMNTLVAGRCAPHTSFYGGAKERG